MTTHFADALLERLAAGLAPVCVGLDPVLEKLPEAVRSKFELPTYALRAFSIGVIDAIADLVPVVKFQAACYERHGSPGVVALEAAMRHARDAGLLVLLDAKRGDIGISSDHYAAAAVNAGAHAITVNGYLGPSGIAPFLAAGLGVFVLVRTSNPDSDAVQSQRLVDGRSIAEMMADIVHDLGATHVGAGGFSSVGAVVGATKAREAAALRTRMPTQLFLIPGYGAQGGTAADVQAMLTRDKRGVLVTASRSVIYAPASEGESWHGAVRRAARALAEEIKGVINA